MAAPRLPKRFAVYALLAAVLSLTGGTLTVRAADLNAPHLAKQGAATQLVVDGKPLLILGGAVSDAEAASPDALKPAWTRLTANNVNTALVPVKWSAIEPTEGQFNFAAVDALLKDAQANKLHVIIQWCGSWNSGTSSSVPAWVKTDTKALADDAAASDAKAFAALLKHIAGADAAHTVIAGQVEGKVAIQGDAALGQPVAKVAAYIGKVAAAGKAAYAIPLYVECAVDKPDAATAFMESVRATAPAIDLIAPDIHAPNFAVLAAKFAGAGNPLFIAEATGGPTGAAELLYAFGKYNAIGIGGTTAPADAAGAADTAIPAFYKVVAGMAPGILDNQGKNTLYAFMFGPGAIDEVATQEVVAIGPFTLTVSANGGGGRGGAGAGAGGGAGGRGGRGGRGGAAPGGAAPGGAAVPANFGAGATVFVAAPAPGGGAAGAGRGAGGARGGFGGGFGGRGGGGDGANIGTSTTVSGIIIALKTTPYDEFLVLHSGLGISVAPSNPALGAFALGFQETGNFVDGQFKTYTRTNGDENDHDRRNTGAFNARWTNLHAAFYQRP